MTQNGTNQPQHKTQKHPAKTPQTNTQQQQKHQTNNTKPKQQALYK